MPGEVPRRGVVATARLQHCRFAALTYGQINFGTLCLLAAFPKLEDLVMWSRQIYSRAAALEVRSRVRRANVIPKMIENDFKKAPSELLARLCFADRLGAVVHCTLPVAALGYDNEA